MGFETILIVEDDDGTREALALLLEARGYHALQASDGIAALEIARESRPDLILSGLRMPRMNGWEFLRAKNADAELASIPVIIITAARDQAPENVPVIPKPAPIREILRQINALESS